MPTVLLRAIPWEVVHAERSRAHEAHLAFQDVEESRKFIQAGAAHQLAKACESILVGQELPVGSAGIGHGTEFICLKGLLVEPRAFLYEQQRPPVKNPCRQRHNPSDRKNEREKAHSHQQVEDALSWEESSDGRLGGVEHVVHNRFTFCVVWRAMKSGDHRRVKTLRQGVVLHQQVRLCDSILGAALGRATVRENMRQFGAR